MFRLIVASLLVLGCSAHAPFTQFGVNPYGGLARPFPVAPVPVQHLRSFPAPAPLPLAPRPLPVPAVPVRTTYTAPVSYAPVVHQTYAQPIPQPQVLDVQPIAQPVHVNFATASAHVSVHQTHIPAPPVPIQRTRHIDTPHKVIHEVIKPVIQEVIEIIQPYRRITQEIRPVIEEVHTIIHKGERRLPPPPLPLLGVAPAFGAGAALVANTGYKAKAA